MDYIDQRRDRWGVEPICRALQFAPQTYYATKARPVSARAVRDAELCVEILRVYEENRRVYGADKIWTQLNREGIRVARCTVERLMRRLGIQGIRRGRRWKTTIPDELQARPSDLVDRNFTAPAPNRLWVADLTYVKTHSGFVYVAIKRRHLQPLRRRLASIDLATQRPGPRRARDGDPLATRRARQWACASQRQRRAISLHSLHRTTR